MSVREGLLALLGERPSNGNQLKTGFEEATGGVWPLNVGQVYTTLDRLERDGLVAQRAPRDGGAQRHYELTPAGREELAAWWSLVPADDPPPRDELMLKVLFAIGQGEAHALAVITAHRTALLSLLQRRRREQRDAPSADVATAVVRDALRGARRGRPALARHVRSAGDRATERKHAMSAILEFDDVVKSFGSGLTEVRALRGVTFSVSEGEFVAVMGPSGCGKSTMLHLAGALESPSAGSVRVGGLELAGLSAADRSELRRNDVGYVFQRLNLIPSLTAIENVMLPLELAGVAPREVRGRALDALTTVGLTERVDRYPDDFSGGQQQRIAIARAIVGSRRLLLADEPTGSLDTASSDEVIELLAALPREQGTAIVLVTHEPRFASWADRVLFLRDGRIVDETAAESAPAVTGSAVAR